MSTETEAILDTFREMLSGPTGDGQNKRRAGTKVLWTIDPEHGEKMLRHLGRWWNGETADPDSGCHPLVHVAWRALAVAWQETHDADEIPGQTFWQEMAPALPPTPLYFNHDPRPLPRVIDRAPCATKALADREPLPTDGPDYHEEHAAWERRQPASWDVV